MCSYLSTGRRDEILERGSGISATDTACRDTEVEKRRSIALRPYPVDRTVITLQRTIESGELGHARYKPAPVPYSSARCSGWIAISNVFAKDLGFVMESVDVVFPPVTGGKAVVNA